MTNAPPNNEGTRHINTGMPNVGRSSRRVRKVVDIDEGRVEQIIFCRDCCGDFAGVLWYCELLFILLFVDLVVATL